MRLALAISALALAACVTIHLDAGSAQLAAIGDACSEDADCIGLNGGCFDGTCRGGDSDPCELHHASGEPDPCAPGFACAACPVDILGPYECRCEDPEASPPTGCAPAVCVSLFDACMLNDCTLAGCGAIEACQAQP